MGASPNESLLLLQAFMGVLTVPALALTAGESQRRRAEESLRQSEASLRVALEAGHMGLVVGRTAAKTTVPTIIDFLRSRSEPVGAGSAIARSAAGVEG